jgi:hypothetical protein
MIPFHLIFDFNKTVASMSSQSQVDGLKLWADKTKDELDKKKTETELKGFGITLIKKCECGADKVDSPFHSTWCPKNVSSV